MLYSESNNDSSNKEDLFMKDFKFYKQYDKNKLNTNTDIINIDELTDEAKLLKFNFKSIDLNLNKTNINNQYFLNYGLKPLNKWSVYESNDIAGLYLIQNPFLPGYQRFFIKKCLTCYHDLPNKTNLDAHIKREQNLWETAVKKKDFTEFNKLRWATIGYHYDWTNKIYNDDDFNSIPTDVENLSKLIASIIGFENYKPEAGIINYYHLNSTLSAHQDHSEKNMQAPLISISFGSSAIFLIGDTSKDIKPKAIWLKSGDIVIMSGKSRLSYHAVPKIFNDSKLKEYFEYDLNELKENFKQSEYYVDDEQWSLVYDYIKMNRINLNIRQVF